MIESGAAHFLGVDIAGSENTWVAGLRVLEGRPVLALRPQTFTLSSLVAFADQHDVVAACIDAQLSIAASDENGFRSSDMELRDLLPEKSRNWVASFNSLMAVPIRARLLTERLAPTVATIVETHPRACLHFLTGAMLSDSLQAYKKPPDGGVHARKLWDAWTEAHEIAGEPPAIVHDGALDALVCATVAYLFHAKPDRLLRLRHTAIDRSGHGPFYVLRPEPRPAGST